MNFTLVSTVFNEAKRLDQTIADLNAQTLQPSEIIITDAGSTDGTYERLLQWKATSTVPVVILQKNRCNVAAGRNLAIKAAKNDLIASTDFGCRFHPKWLESIMAPFSNPDVKAVAGAYAVSEDDLQSLPAKAAYLLFNGYQDDIKEEWFTPTSRSIAYYKELFYKVGGYPEWLTLASDDTIFGRLAKKMGFTFFIAEKPYVFWGRHTTAIGYAKEAFRYGLGDGESGINLRSTVIKFLELVLRILFILVLAGIIGFFITGYLSGYWYLLLIPFATGFRPYIKHIGVWKKFRSGKYNFKVLLYSFYLLELTRYYYLKGFYKGYFKSPEFRKAEAKKLSVLFAS